MNRALLALIFLVACSGGDTDHGRMEISRDGGLLTIRDTTHVLTLPLKTASKDRSYVQLALSEAEFPGRIAFADEQRGELVAFWITRLGAKRPENIQRWFDEKLARVKLGGGTIVKDEGTKFGEHPARIADITSPGADGPLGHYRRFIGVDIPEHDLEVVVIGVLAAPAPSPAGQKWLDDLTADVRAMEIAPPAAK